MLIRLKRFIKYLAQFDNRDYCSCGIHLCTSLDLKELKIIHDSLKDYDPEEDIFEERTSAYRYIYDMDDVQDLRDSIQGLLQKRVIG